MGGNDRRGARKDRNKKLSTRVPTLGYYLIITDSQETEKNYFEGLRKTIPDSLKNRLVIKVERARTAKLVQKCKELVSKEPQYRIPWIVLDRDHVEGFDEIIAKAEENDIKVGWSNPCIEIWFFAYFGAIPSYIESTTCCQKFEDKFKKITGNTYRKSDVDIYDKLNQLGDEKRALEIADLKYGTQVSNGILKPSGMGSTTTLYKLIGEIRDKIDHSHNV